MMLSDLFWSHHNHKHIRLGGTKQMLVSLLSKFLSHFSVLMCDSEEVICFQALQSLTAFENECRPSKQSKHVRNRLTHADMLTMVEKQCNADFFRILRKSPQVQSNFGDLFKPIYALRDRFNVGKTDVVLCMYWPNLRTSKGKHPVISNKQNIMLGGKSRSMQGPINTRSKLTNQRTCRQEALICALHDCSQIDEEQSAGLDERRGGAPAPWETRGPHA